jgi:hypothetical protein
LLAVTLFSGGITTAIVVAGHPINLQNSLLNFALLPLPLIAGALFAVTFGWLALFATRSQRLEFQPSLETIGNLSRWIVANAPYVVKEQRDKWSREQVSETVRQIVIDTLGCHNEYREDAHFVKDLGLS